MARRSFRLRFLLIFIVLLTALYLARPLWLPLFGFGLIHEDGPAKADIAVVLAGDYHGLRILKAGDMVRAGYVPQVLVSGPPDFYGHPESELAIPFAVSRGYPAEWFIPLLHQGLSTKTEGEAVLEELRRRNVKSFLLVTSDYHTGRSRRTYLALEKKAGGGPSFRTVSAPDKFFRPQSWWRDREAQKIVFVEWTKSFATVFGF